MPENRPLFLPHADAATRLAQLCAGFLREGDSVLIQGPVGAGKSHFARAVIQTHLGPQAEVPSPTFTLVQVYSGPFEIWHADLYRLTHSHEVQEIGLDDALGHALCLIEWPDRLGDIAVPNAVHVDLSYHGDGRMAHVTGGRGDMMAALWAEFAP
jgi:tRNA threonylcarbamoyladenosine biosynthesis protein TsaE